jgi:hypothetical protein
VLQSFDRTTQRYEVTHRLDRLLPPTFSDAAEAGRVTSQLGALLNDVDGAATREIADVCRTAAALGDLAALDLLLSSKTIPAKINAYLEGDADSEYSPLLAAIWENQVIILKTGIEDG